MTRQIPLRVTLDDIARPVYPGNFSSFRFHVPLSSVRAITRQLQDTADESQRLSDAQAAQAGVFGGLSVSQVIIDEMMNLDPPPEAA